MSREGTQTYRRLLERCCDAADEAVRQQAYQLGRERLAAGLGLLDLATLHHQALAELAENQLAPGQIAAAGEVLNEVLAAYEMLLRGTRDANLALRGLTERLERQAEHIARALHDESGQLLAVVMIRLDALAADVPAPFAGEVAAVRRLLDNVEGQLRRLAHEMHPAVLAELGLPAALQFLAEGVAARAGLQVCLAGALAERPAPAVEL